MRWLLHAVGVHWGKLPGPDRGNTAMDVGCGEAISVQSCFAARRQRAKAKGPGLGTPVEAVLKPTAGAELAKCADCCTPSACTRLGRVALTNAKVLWMWDLLG